ncbi:hypothetical protein MTP99_015960 [Tenebrio molitor]|nr:hypothetical protein MTP99_015960 [Tenebrio molitor]
MGQHLHGEIEEAPKPSRAKTTSTGGELFHIGNGGLAIQETRASNQNRCQNSPKQIAQFIPQLNQGDGINPANPSKRQRREEDSDTP